MKAPPHLRCAHICLCKCCYWINPKPAGPKSCNSSLPNMKKRAFLRRRGNIAVITMGS